MSLRMMATWTCVCSVGSGAAWCAAMGALGLSTCAALARRPRACQTESGCALSAAWAAEVSSAAETTAAANSVCIPCPWLLWSYLVCCNDGTACILAFRNKTEQRLPPGRCMCCHYFCSQIEVCSVAALKARRQGCGCPVWVCQGGRTLAGSCMASSSLQPAQSAGG